MTEAEKKTRSTAQQRLIREIFESSDRPLNAAEVLEIAREARPTIGIATVYRGIRSMLDDGLLVMVAIAGETSYFEMASREHHHYFHCCYCRKVYVIGACPEVIDELTPPGFVHEHHDIVLHGYCRECKPDRK